MDSWLMRLRSCRAEFISASSVKKMFNDWILNQVQDDNDAY